jgi:hypothetical protein
MHTDEGKTVWPESDGRLGKLKWKAYPTPPRGGGGRILRREILGDIIRLQIPGPFLTGEVPALLPLSISTINLC